MLRPVAIMRLAGEPFEEPLWGSCTGPRQQEGWGCRCLGCGEARTWCPGASLSRPHSPSTRGRVPPWTRGHVPRSARCRASGLVQRQVREVPRGGPGRRRSRVPFGRSARPGPRGGAACSVPPRRRGAPGAPTGGRRLAQPSCCADSGTAPASFSSGAGRPGTSPRCPAGARGVRWGAGLADPRAAPPRLPPALRLCSRWCPRAASGPRVETVGALPSCSAPSRARAGSGLSRARGL